jgi:hypothetical protein
VVHHTACEHCRDGAPQHSSADGRTIVYGFEVQLDMPPRKQPVRDFDERAVRRHIDD